MAEPQDSPASQSKDPNRAAPPPSSGPSPTPASPSTDLEARRKRRPAAGIAFVLVLAALAAGGYFYWRMNVGFETTDDAFIDGRAIGVASEVAGKVASLDVSDNRFVHKGQPLLHIDARQYEHDRDLAKGALDAAQSQHEGFAYGVDIARKNFPALLEQAKAQLASAEATRQRAQSDYTRQRNLPKDATTQQEVDAAAAALAVAEAQVATAKAQVVLSEPAPQRIAQAETQVGQQNGQIEQAEARLAQAELNLERTLVVAPTDGWITKRNVEAGDYVAPGQPLMSIVAPEVWVTADFKENQLDHMRPGQPATIGVDAYPSLALEGHVDSIQRGTGSKFTAFPPENATGNFVKIVQRVPVKIVIDSGLDANLALPLGLSVAPRVKVQ